MKHRAINSLHKTGRLLFAWGPILATVTALTSSCGGQLGGPQFGSESHFLRYCDASCGDGLSCIGGVCTETCIITEQDSCEKRAKGAACTNLSGEPGDVAVCDVVCDETVDCKELSSDHACFEGYCRAPADSADSGANPPDPSGRYQSAQLAEFPLGGDHLSCGFSPRFWGQDEALRCHLVLVEVTFPGGTEPHCFADGRQPLNEEATSYLRTVLRDVNCSSQDPDCMQWSFCEIVQLEGDEQDACQRQDVDPTELSSGFCAIDLERMDAGGVPSAGGGSKLQPLLEAECGGAPDSPRALRLTGQSIVEPIDSEIWLVCEDEP